jgi:hypothetical protein
MLLPSQKCPDIKNLKNAPYVVDPDKIKFLLTAGIHDVRYIEFNNLESIINGVIPSLVAYFVPESAIRKYEKARLLRSFFWYCCTAILYRLV